jgi:hypothetical protein
MKRIGVWIAGTGFALLALAGCHSKNESPAPTATPEPMATEQSAASVTAAPTSQVISSARDSLKSGNVDEAAARLAQLQLQGASFNAQQAKDYRQALSDAYDRAIEAAQRGDPKGEAALKLLRAAAPR